MKKHLNVVLAMLVLMAAGVAQTHMLPEGSEIKVRTDTAIPAKPAANARYTASVSNDVTDSSGAVVIPRGSRATLVAVPNPDGKDTTLDLRSVRVNGQSYLLQAPGETSSSPEGLGANKRTAKYVGGGAAIGAVLGALLGGGKGAGIGAIVGGAGGAAGQVLTGKKKEMPAETELSFKLAQNLQLQPVSSGGRSHRPAQPQ
ncbi:MAG TPA: hypothetical protein VFA60_02550 [Terriglobales bacterium]|nr:hypothetical protein [Terriglobales bacterium]